MSSAAVSSALRGCEPELSHTAREDNTLTPCSRAPTTQGRTPVAGGWFQAAQVSHRLSGEHRWAGRCEAWGSVPSTAENLDLKPQECCTAGSGVWGVLPGAVTPAHTLDRALPCLWPHTCWGDIRPAPSDAFLIWEMFVLCSSSNEIVFQSEKYLVLLQGGSDPGPCTSDSRSASGCIPGLFYLMLF